MDINGFLLALFVLLFFLFGPYILQKEDKLVHDLKKHGQT